MTTWDLIIALFYHIDEQLHAIPRSTHGERLDRCIARVHLSSVRWIFLGLLAGGLAPVCAPGHAALRVG